MKTKIFSFLFLLMAATLMVHAQSDANGKSLYLCIFNAACYKQFQQQAVQMGYKADKADGKSSTLFYMKDDAPTITFMQLEKPMPYCIIITE